jgi:hypothetical protein
MSGPADATNVLQQLLGAAQTAAGANWAAISGDVQTFAQEITQSTAQTTEDLVSGAISESEAKVQYDELTDFTAMLAEYGDAALKATAQAALNAVVDKLWAIALAAIPK